MNATPLIRAAAALALAAVSTFAADITGKGHGSIANTKIHRSRAGRCRVPPV